MLASDSIISGSPRAPASDSAPMASMAERSSGAMKASSGGIAAHDRSRSNEFCCYSLNQVRLHGNLQAVFVTTPTHISYRSDWHQCNRADRRLDTLPIRYWATSTGGGFKLAGEMIRAEMDQLSHSFQCRSIV